MYTPSKRSELSRAVAAAMLAGEWEQAAAARSVGQALEPRARWTPAVVREVLAAYPRSPSDRPRELARFVELELGARRTQLAPPRVRRWFVSQSAMGRMRWPVPRARRTRSRWRPSSSLEIGELDWLCDTRGLERSASDRAAAQLPLHVARRDAADRRA